MLRISKPASCNVNSSLFSFFFLLAVCACNKAVLTLLSIRIIRNDSAAKLLEFRETPCELTAKLKCCRFLAEPFGETNHFVWIRRSH